MDYTIVVQGQVPSRTDLERMEALWKGSENISIDVDLVDLGSMELYVTRLVECSGLEVSQAIMSEIISMGVLNEEEISKIYRVADIGNRCEIAMRANSPDELVADSLSSGDFQLVEAAAMNKKTGIDKCLQRLVTAENDDIARILIRVIELKRGV